MITLQQKHDEATEDDKEFDLLKVLYANEDFNPTTLMIKLLVAFVEDNEDRKPQVVLRDDLESSTSLWWMWRKNSPGFIKWWNTCLESVYSGFGVPEVWKAVRTRAVNHSDAAAKLFIERFDTKYKPTTSQERTYSFAGYKPDQTTAELAEKSRQRKSIANKEIEDEV